jgi:hypothetical protein
MKVELPGENIPARGTLVAMTTRTNSKLQHPFELKRVDRVLPPGEYRVVTGELLIGPIGCILWSTTGVYGTIESIGEIGS